MNTGLEIIPGKERHYGRWFFLFLMACLLALAGWYIYQWYTTGQSLPISIPIARADPRIDESDVSQVMIDTYSVPSANPRYVIIPSIGVDKTRIYPVGVNEQNMLDTPRNINDAAWYKKSTTPGTGYGAVLLDGHNGGMSKNGIFAKLSQLKEDDQITIIRGDKQQFTYKVVENETVSLDEANKTGMKKMMESVEPDKEGLNIITCAGKWVPRIQQFDQRVMIRAVAI